MGAQLDIPDINGSTPIHIACTKGGTEIVKEMISYRANVNVRQKDDSLPCKSKVVKM